MNQTIADMTLGVLKALGRYQVEGLLGQGGMGIVYKAFDTKIERAVALKTIHPHLLAGTEGADLRRRFLQEVKAAARCSHPNIVTIFDFGEHDGLPFIAMEFIEGPELRKCLSDRRQLGVKESAAVVLQVLEALDFAHEAGVLHRDVKPSNVHLLGDGRVKLTDFGVARLEDQVGQTQVGSLIGTPAYMAPELMQGGAASPGSDLYATGVMLLEMVSGLRLAPGQALHALDDLARPPAAGGPNAPEPLPPPLITVLRKALAERPGARFRRARELSEALRAALGVSSLDDLIHTHTLCATGTKQAMPLEPVQALPVPDGSSFSWSSEILDQVEFELAKAIGPVARMAVRQQSRKAPDLETLCRTVAEMIPNDGERRAFLSAFDLTEGGARATPSGNPSAPAASLPPAVLAAAEARLAQYLGPMAKVFVRKAAKQALDVDDLYQRLANHLKDVDERAAFLAGRPKA